MNNYNFGCGGNILKGFHNFDQDMDLTKPLPIESDSADFVLAEHVLEHLTVAQAVAAMDEFYRILKKGRTVRICCPVLERLTVPEARDIALNHGHQIIFSTQSLKDFVRLPGFRNIRVTPWKPCDGHHVVIGRAKDAKETARVEGMK